ncbi:hypothetical protein D3C81_1899890 [compost metagenome]
MEGVAVEATGIGRTASTPHALLQVIASVDFESDSQDTFGVAACTRREQEVGPLSQQLRLPRARARRQRYTTYTLLGRNICIGL